jgi:hypothetical protein
VILAKSGETLLSQAVCAFFEETHFTVGVPAHRSWHKAELYATVSMAFQASSW